MSVTFLAVLALILLIFIGIIVWFIVVAPSVADEEDVDPDEEP